MEQLNIEGKRSGDGFVAHKAMLVSALSRALAARVVVGNITIGTKGFLAYLKALGGSNVVKVIPATTQASSTGNASPDVSGQVASKGLKVVCGANTSYLTEGAWIKDGTSSGRGIRGGTPLTFCEVRVSPSTAVKPNIGANELAHALNRVLPFTSTDANRQIQQCVNVEAKEGKLVLVATDGFSLADVSLPYDEGEGNALIDRDIPQGSGKCSQEGKQGQGRVRAIGRQAGRHEPPCRHRAYPLQVAERRRHSFPNGAS